MKTIKNSKKPDCRERLRRALSYREKALREAGNGNNEGDRFAGASHAREAERLLQGIHDEITRQAAQLGDQLQETLAQQARLVEDVSSGAVSARRANRKNRFLSIKIAAFRAQLTDLNDCLNADSPDAVGGFHDAPLPAYPTLIRKPVPRVSAKPTRAGFVVWVAMVGLAVLASLHYVGYFDVQPPLILEIDEVEAESGNIRIVCRNDSQEPILLHVPWHSKLSPGATGAGRGKAYGIAVYVREETEKNFRLYPVAVNTWTYQGRVVQDSGPVEVAPHLYVSFVLDTKTALAAANPGAVRIVLLNSKGQPVVEHQILIGR